MTFKFESSAGYLQAVDYLLSHIQDEDIFHNPNKYAFILVAASALESILSDTIIVWAHGRFDSIDEKRMATAFLTMSLRGKLDAFIHLVTDGEYTTNNQNVIYRDLSDLIKVRNEVAHAKEFFFECDIEWVVDEAGQAAFALPDKVMEAQRDAPVALAFEQCRRYQTALHQLRELVSHEVGLDRIKASAFCKLVTQQPHGVRVC